MLQTLKDTFIVGQGMRWLVVEGDAKLYEVVQGLKFEYGRELGWVIPYPGDFHVLMNYQKSLMKPYYDTGLKSLAQVAGYPVAAIQNCSQFQRSHHFIFGAWEAIYRVMLLQYLHQRHSNSTSLLDELTEHIQSLPQENFTCTFNKHLESKSKFLCEFFEGFCLFVQESAHKDDTWRFWVQFVFQDAMAYISLFLAIRSGDWTLRMASIKSMAAVFTAFDHHNYQKLLSQHLADIPTMPAPIIAMSMGHL